MSLSTRCPLLFTKFRNFQNFSQACHCSKRNLSERRVGILGVSLAKGQRKSGTEIGPTVLRSTKLIQTLQDELGYSVVNHGNVLTQGNIQDSIVRKVRNPQAIGNICQRISSKVQSIVMNGELCITLGGDHSLAIGTIHGHTRVNPNVLVIWVDAHADINTATSTNSGNMHGMPMSFHLHELNKYNENIPGFDWLEPSLTGKDIVYIGLRDVEPLERLILDKCGITTYAMPEIDRLGISEITKRILDSKGNRPIHVSFDIDAYDTSVAPSTGTAVPGGLTLREGLTFAEEIYKTGRLKALDLVEVNARIGDEFEQEKTLFAATQTILAFCGNCRGGNESLNTRDIPMPVTK